VSTSKWAVPESEMPCRVVEYLYVLVLLRLAVEKGEDPGELIEALRKFDYDEMKQAHKWLSKTIIERYDVTIKELTVKRDLFHRRSKAKTKRKSAGEKSRRFVADRYRYWRTTRRLPESDIPAKIAKESAGNCGIKNAGLSEGRVKNIVRELKAAARI